MPPGPKTRLCNFFGKGACNRGPACPFAHGDAELQELPVSHAEKQVGHKTRLCTFFSNKGSCNNGGSCQFAHGDEELQPFSSKGWNPKGKSKGFGTDEVKGGGKGGGKGGTEEESDNIFVVDTRSSKPLPYSDELFTNAERIGGFSLTVDYEQVFDEGELKRLDEASARGGAVGANLYEKFSEKIAAEVQAKRLEYRGSVRPFEHLLKWFQQQDMHVRSSPGSSDRTAVVVRRGLLEKLMKLPLAFAPEQCKILAICRGNYVFLEDEPESGGAAEGADSRILHTGTAFQSVVTNGGHAGRFIAVTRAQLAGTENLECLIVGELDCIDAENRPVRIKCTRHLPPDSTSHLGAAPKMHPPKAVDMYVQSAAAAVQDILVGFRSDSGVLEDVLNFTLQEFLETYSLRNNSTNGECLGWLHRFVRRFFPWTPSRI
ncbi:unnamed protein product [Polarella glacialis]|uniref:Decapping nuclease n=1 Tax=Polarella glacialis TaxID=89957 RepID=A0A813D7Q4_POLGL|nr:unnamed protein product [Polarella glacialis]